MIQKCRKRLTWRNTSSRGKRKKNQMNSQFTAYSKTEQESKMKWNHRCDSENSIHCESNQSLQKTEGSVSHRSDMAGNSRSTLSSYANHSQFVINSSSPRSMRYGTLPLQILNCAKIPTFPNSAFSVEFKVIHYEYTSR